MVARTLLGAGVPLRLYATIEIDASRRPFDAKRHIVASIANLREYFGVDSLDLVLCNGVFGWGLDAPDEVRRAFAACASCLRPGAVSCSVGTMSRNIGRSIHSRRLRPMHCPLAVPPVRVCAAHRGHPRL